MIRAQGSLLPSREGGFVVACLRGNDVAGPCPATPGIPRSLCSRPLTLREGGLLVVRRRGNGVAPRPPRAYPCVLAALARVPFR